MSQPTAPRRFIVGDYIMVTERSREHRGRRGTINEVRDVERECLIAFEDGRLPVRAYVKMRWLER